MTCDELQLLLPERAGDEGSKAHLAQCAECRETAAVLSLAAQPPMVASEKAKLASLPVAVHAAWSRQQRRGELARRVVGLAVAASLGAVVASGVMWTLKDERPRSQPAPEVSWVMDDEPSPVTEEEPNYEVSWPSLNEDGDVQ